MATEEREWGEWGKLVETTQIFIFCLNKYIFLNFEEMKFGERRQEQLAKFFDENKSNLDL